MNDLSTVHLLTVILPSSFIPPSMCSHLFPGVVGVFLEGPGHSGLQGFGDTLQEGAAPFHPKQPPLCHSVLVVVYSGRYTPSDNMS